MFYNGIELYVKDNKVGLLISPGYGAGWSTWNEKELAYDKRVIDFWLAHKDNLKFIQDLQDLEARFDGWKEAKDFFNSLGYDDPYLGGFADVELIFVDFNTPWIIEEYDGYESLRTLDDMGFITFIRSDVEVNHV